MPSSAAAPCRQRCLACRSRTVLRSTFSLSWPRPGATTWGAGMPIARHLLEEIALQHPDVLIHLGDIYYSGTSRLATYAIILVHRRAKTMTQSRLKEPKSEQIATLAPTGHVERNPGCDLDLSWVEAARVNRSAVERRAATLAGRRTVKQDWQAAWLLRAISCIDLTTLAGDDTPGTVQRLCA